MSKPLVVAVVGDHSYFDVFVIMSKYANVPSHYDAQGVKKWIVGAGHRQLCRP